MKLSVGVAIITYKDIAKLEISLPLILKSKLHPKVLVFNSTSNDGCVEFAKKLGVETLVIPRTDMNHGYAREVSRKALGTDIVIMMTPDAYITDDMFEKLIEPIVDGEAVVAYPRQVAHEGANIISRFGREFNFPEKSNIRSIKDAPKYGVYTAFVSDSCTAWSNKALDEIGGFRWVLSGEDAVAAAMILRKGYKIAYVAEAVVRHSHNYSPTKEFVRHFDTGMYRKQWHKILDLGGGNDQKRGTSYAQALLTYVLKNEPLMFPTAFLQLTMGWLGYQLGWICYHRAPLWFYKMISPADFFWNSTGYKEGKWFEPAK
ncbi:MAG TPA: glycosyltransferase [Patescibacteria group bacterium]|nr:glycosyltransferase [Patescibacteria group bacterium]